MAFERPSAAAATDTTGILLVDDDPGILETLVDIFEDMGYEADTAATGAQALEKLGGRFFNLALLDIQLPDMQGTELLAQVRERQPETVCIMATGNASLPTAVESLNRGAYAYLQKPIEVPEVKATVRRALQQQRLELENRALLLELQDVARTLSQSFLTEPPKTPQLEIGYRFETKFELASFGGDYFDFIEFSPERIGIAIGDVSGKGLPAHKYAVMAKHVLRAYALENSSPRWVIGRVNHALFTQMSDEFITLTYGVLDLAGRSFTYTNAGHPPPILYHPGRDELKELAPTGGMVGALPRMEFHEATVPFEPGSLLVMFTDGVTEARTGQAMLESSGVEAVVRANATRSATEIASAIFERAYEFAGGVLKDDVAIVVIRSA
jgi:sigma-B regulation protein RsbU (phosphoserine phosphatase)